MNNKTRIVSLIILSLFITALITRNGDVVWMMLPFLGYLGIGILQTPDREKLNFHVNRTSEQGRDDGNVSVTTNLSLKNDSPIPVHLFMSDNIQPEMKVTDGEPCQWVSLLPGESTELKYSISVRRGNYSWNSIRLTVGDPLGLISSDVTLSAPDEIQVRPTIRKYKAIALRPHSTLHSPGSIPARLGGSGTDFFGVREYHAGDPLRSLDWRMTARNPHKLFTKEFEQEEIAEIGLILDARQCTELKIGEESLFEHSVGAAASLAETFLHQGHRVSLLVFGKRMSIAFPGYGKTQLHRIMSCLSKAKVEVDERSSSHLDFLPIRMFPSRSMIIVISPLASFDRTLYQRLRAHGYQALLVSPNPIYFAAPILAQDINSRLAIRTTLIERRLLLDTITQLKIPVIDWQVDQPLYPQVRNALTRSRGQGA
jgi:uncharacterized protein (DUF58 family)